MRQLRRDVVFAIALLAAPALASASGFGLYQHGGRATGQAGAFTARAADPSAVFYNPAAITTLPGSQYQAGLDFSNATDEYSSASGSFKSQHVITFPPALYATWNGDGPFAFGLGLDSPFFYNLDWDPALFPGRFLIRRFDLTVFELHPVVAWEVAPGWSLGGGVRYLYGSLTQEDNVEASFFQPGGAPVIVEVERNAEADVDALAWDLAIHYQDPVWGWGAVLRSAVELEGDGDVSYRGRDVPAALEAAVRARFAGGSTSQSFELPWELRGGVWVAPYPELRLELDAAYQAWSGLDDTSISYRPDLVGDGPTLVTSRDWEDVISLRLGLEGEVTESFWLTGGVGWEPSPVPGDTIEPGFPRGDALVYALGATYNFPDISFDLGYSFHEHDDRGASGQEPFNPGVDGSYGSRDQVWGFSVRWRR